MRCVEQTPHLAGARPRQRGAAVILALVTVFLTAVVAASLIADMGRALDSAIGQQDQAQARTLARGAVDWARNVLADDGMHTAVDHGREPWAIRVPPTPVGDAEVAGEIIDWSGRFNVNNLAPTGQPSLAALEQFERLLQALGESPDSARKLSRVLLSRLNTRTDDLENNDYLPDGSVATPLPASNAPWRGPLVDIRELHQFPEFPHELVERLTHVAVATPAPSRINLNTAPAEVIFALTSGIDINAARVLVAERERVWYRNVADFTSRLPQGASVLQLEALDVRSRFFLVTGRARSGVATVNLEVLLDRKNIWPDILWQRIP